MCLKAGRSLSMGKILNMRKGQVHGHSSFWNGFLHFIVFKFKGGVTKFSHCEPDTQITMVSSKTAEKSLYAKSFTDRSFNAAM